MITTWMYQTSQKIILNHSFIVALKRAPELHCLYDQETRYTTPGQRKRRLNVLPLVFLWDSEPPTMTVRLLAISLPWEGILDIGPRNGKDGRVIARPLREEPLGVQAGG